MRSSPQIYAALDTPDLDRALHLARALMGVVDGLKVGLEFFVAQGQSGIKSVIDQGLPVFLDLKLHDIPNTVAGAVRALLPLQPQYVTLHASGGLAMLEAAVAAVRESGAQRPKLLVVTVLTSLSSSDLQTLGVPATPTQQVERLAALAKKAGCDGVVCSPHEARAVRKVVGDEMLIVLPGIRPLGAVNGDQKRTMSPREAAQAGADILVIGRPLTAARDPAAVARAIAAEL